MHMCCFGFIISHIIPMKMINLNQIILTSCISSSKHYFLPLSYTWFMEMLYCHNYSTNPDSYKTLPLKKRKWEKKKQKHMNKNTIFDGCHHAGSSRDLNFYLRVKKVSLFPLFFCVHFQCHIACQSLEQELLLIWM